MNISPKALSVDFDRDQMWVRLEDGRTLGLPLAWFPRLAHATEEQIRQVEISRRGLHWEEIDENISIAGLIAGRGDMTSAPSRAA